MSRMGAARAHQRQVAANLTPVPPKSARAALAPEVPARRIRIRAWADRDYRSQVLRWEDAYLRDGYFYQDRMLGLIEEILKKGKDEGFPLTRLIANMEWALEDRPGVETILDYETKLNYILPRYDDAVC